jgi:alcohol dehydrogenase class IV
VSGSGCNGRCRSASVVAGRRVEDAGIIHDIQRRVTDRRERVASGCRRGFVAVGVVAVVKVTSFFTAGASFFIAVGGCSIVVAASAASFFTAGASRIAAVASCSYNSAGFVQWD